MKLRFVTAMAAIACAILAPAQTVDDKPEVKKQIVEAIVSTIERSAYVPNVDFTKLRGFVEKVQPDIDAAKNDEEFQRAINRAFSNFGFSHIALSTPRAAQTRRTASTVGIGITPRITPEGVAIARTVPGAPAEEAGLKPGDLILEVDGKKLEGTRNLSGEEGTKVKIKVKRLDGAEKEFELTRRRFKTTRPEELTWINADTAKLTVYTFDFSYSSSNVRQLMGQAAKAKNLVLDLRSNGGGLVRNLQHLLGFFLPSDTKIGTFLRRGLVNRYIEETKGDVSDLAAIARWSPEKVKPLDVTTTPFKGEVAVLINGGSGSASEIVAQALKDHSSAIIVGTKSAGAVLASVIVPVSNGFNLQFPQSDYVTIRGVRLEGNGIEPDVEDNSPVFLLPNEKDTAIEKALALLERVRLRKERMGG